MIHDHNIEDFDLLGTIKVPKDHVIFNGEDTPAIILNNPRFAHNVGAVVRACSCFDAKTVMFTGDRVIKEISQKGYRIPREERMRGYSDVSIVKDDYPLNRFKNIIPVAVEVRPNSEQLPYFIHPENPVYIFGPEDGSIPQVILQHCHRFLTIPSKHCLNLSAAVYVVLYDRKMKMMVKENI